MGIAAVRDGKLAIAVCVMHACILFASMAIITKAQYSKRRASAPWWLPARVQGYAWYAAMVILFCLYAAPIVIYVLLAAHTSLFKELLHHVTLSVVALLVSFFVLPWWYHGVLWPASVCLASTPTSSKQKRT